MTWTIIFIVIAIGRLITQLMVMRLKKSPEQNTIWHLANNIFKTLGQILTAIVGISFLSTGGMCGYAALLPFIKGSPYTSGTELAIALVFLAVGLVMVFNSVPALWKKLKKLFPTKPRRNI